MGILLTRERGYSLVELIVALLLFSIGGLALASTSALIGRALNLDGQRERASRLASRQIEILSAACHDAINGTEATPPISLEWTVSRPDTGHIAINESVSYPGSQGRRTDRYETLVSCR